MSDDHRHLYKKTVDADDFRKRREDVSIGIRRNQRAESLQKRRQLSGAPVPEPPVEDFAFQNAALAHVRFCG